MDNPESPAQLDRRRFGVTGLAAGVALAVQPAMGAVTIVTDTHGLAAGNIQIPVKGGAIPGYRAMPDTGGPFPTVLVINQISDLTEYMKDICRRLAKVGYYAIAPALFARHGDMAKLYPGDDREPTSAELAKMSALAAATSDDEMNEGFEGALAFAKAEKGDLKRLGVTGFCLGGTKAWIFTAQNPGVRAVAVWYGAVVGRSGQAPIDLADKMKGRVLGLYGGKDPNISVDSLDQMRAKLKAAGDEKSRIVVYPDAGHGFHNDGTLYRYNEADAKDGWAQMLAWFKSHGVA